MIISVILPCYNTSNYLSTCITSILNQTYNKLELIIVNDGSTDNSENIIKNFSSIDPRIKYLYQSNSGQGSARNLGLKVAKGDYILFVDVVAGIIGVGLVDD